MKIDDESKHRGLTRIDHELRLDPWSPPKFGSTLPARMSENIAACSVVGLTFWSEHPATNTLWAADFSGRYHEVTIDRKKRTAVHLCGKSRRFGPNGQLLDSLPCKEVGRRGEWLKPAGYRELALMLGGEYLNEVEIPKPTAAERRYAKARNEAKAAKRDAEMAALMTAQMDEYRAKLAAADKTPSPAAAMAVSMVANDPSCIVNLHEDYLRLALGHTDHDQAINDELQRREAS